MLGRVGLLRGDLDVADRAARGGRSSWREREHWLSFLPWPQALLGEVLLARGDVAGAAACLEQSFARACQIGDPCWEGISARGLALVAEAAGDLDRAVAVLLDARSRTTRLADPYVWLDVHILDALCALGRRHGHPADPRLGRGDARAGVAHRDAGADRAGHAARGRARASQGDADAALMLAADIDNPGLVPLLAVVG